MLVDGKELVVRRQGVRIARLAYEYDWILDPNAFSDDVRRLGERIDVLSFLGKIGVNDNIFELPWNRERIAVIPLSTYDMWWKKQINDKTRNMIRKSQKAGIDVRLVDLTEELVRGIKGIYDESPLRQGKPFKHYGKDLETLWKDHVTFVERSQFIGAYYEDKLIGFTKLVHGDGLSHLMQIISKKSFQSKAPTNALIAKSVDLCTERRVPYLHYGLWSQRGLGDFKRHHAFECFDLRRYYLPLSWRGVLFLKLKLHRDLSSLVPGWLANSIIDLRTKFYTLRYGLERV